MHFHPTFQVTANMLHLALGLYFASVPSISYGIWMTVCEIGALFQDQTGKPLQLNLFTGGTPKILNN